MQKQIRNACHFFRPSLADGIAIMPLRSRSRSDTRIRGMANKVCAQRSARKSHTHRRGNGESASESPPLRVRWYFRATKRGCLACLAMPGIFVYACPLYKIKIVSETHPLCQFCHGRDDVLAGDGLQHPQTLLGCVRTSASSLSLSNQP